MPRTAKSDNPTSCRLVAEGSAANAAQYQRPRAQDRGSEEEPDQVTGWVPGKAPEASDLQSRSCLGMPRVATGKPPDAWSLKGEPQGSPLEVWPRPTAGAVPRPTQV